MIDVATIRLMIRQENPNRIELGRVVAADSRGTRTVSVRMSGGSVCRRCYTCVDSLEPGDEVIVAHMEGKDRLVVIAQVENQYESNLSRNGILAPPSNLTAISVPGAILLEWDNYPGETVSWQVRHNTSAASAGATSALVTRGSYYYYEVVDADTDEGDPVTHYFSVRAIRWLGDNNVMYSAWSSWATGVSVTWDGRYYQKSELSSADCDGAHGASLIWICDADDNFPSHISNVEVALDYLWDNATGAPVGAEYVTMALHGSLTAERVLTAGAGIALADGGANGNATLTVDQTFTPTWTGLHTFDASIAFGGASGANTITVPDNVADALGLLDAGGLEYLRVVSTDANPYWLLDPAATGINVGIRIATPIAPLDVRGTSGSPYFASIFAGANIVAYSAAGNSPAIMAHSGAGIYVQTYYNAGGGADAQGMYTQVIGDAVACAVFRNSTSGAAFTMASTGEITTTGGITIPAAKGYALGDEAWVGLTGGGMLVFDDVSTPDVIRVKDADFYLDGNKLYLDVNRDTYWQHSTDDQVDLYIAGALDFTFTANTFTVAAGSTIVPASASGQNLGDATHRWDLFTTEVTFGGATAENKILVPDNVADALSIEDGGGLEFLRVISTDAQPRVAIDPGATGMEFGVGLAAPLYPLHVIGNGYLTGNVGIGLAPIAGTALYVVDDTAGDFPAYFWNDGDNQNRYGIRVRGGADDGSGTTYYFFAEAGNAAHTGDLRTTNGVFAVHDVCDERTKANIVDSDIDALDIVSRLRVRDYNYKANLKGPKVRGFIAQEMLDIYPEATGMNPDGMYSMSRELLVPVLVKAIQELLGQVKQLERRPR